MPDICFTSQEQFFFPLDRGLFASLKYLCCIVLVFVLEDSSAGSDLFFTVLWGNIGFENMYMLKTLFYWDQ